MRVCGEVEGFENAGHGACSALFRESDGFLVTAAIGLSLTGVFSTAASCRQSLRVLSHRLRYLTMLSENEVMSET